MNHKNLTLVDFPVRRKACYRNAAMAAMIRRWRYVEGLANGLPHAWNMDGDKIIDLTAERWWKEEKINYISKLTKTGDELREIYSDGKPFENLWKQHPAGGVCI